MWNIWKHQCNNLWGASFLSSVRIEKDFIHAQFGNGGSVAGRRWSVGGKECSSGEGRESEIHFGCCLSRKFLFGSCRWFRQYLHLSVGKKGELHYIRRSVDR